MRSLYPPCLCLALASLARATLPLGPGGRDASSHSGAAVSPQFTGVTSARRSEPSPRALSPDPSKSEADEEASEHCSSTPPESPAASLFLGAGTGSGVPLLRSLLSRLSRFHSAVPVARFGAQVALAYCLTKVSWAVAKEAWEDARAEFAAARGSGGGREVREEHDLPYADDAAFDGGLGGEDEGEGATSDAGEDAGRRPRPRRPGRSEGPPSPQTTALRELAAKLAASGLPYASEASAETAREEGAPTVEGIVRSLTRAEGSMLAQTLLDGELVGGVGRAESPAAAAAAWNAIGGLAEAKESLLDLAFPLLSTHSDSEQNSGYGDLLANPPGALLYGPPGCGKTILVRALAATVGARFLAVSPSCLLRKYVGETNLNVRALFSAARKIAPTVIFVDELDGLFRERGGEDHDVGRDLKTEFLQEWDGIRHHARGGGSPPSILVIGATNRPYEVDPAFLRRMPRRVFVGLPDYDSRVSVLKGMLKQVPLEEHFDVGLVAGKTGGYSPSDMREVLQAAALYPLREARAEAMSRDTRMPSRIHIPPLRKLRTDDVVRALEVAKPTHFSRRYQKELMDFVRNSGGSYRERVEENGVSEKDTNDNFFIADAGTFTQDYEDESDTYSYDEDSSDSDDI